MADYQRGAFSGRIRGIGGQAAVPGSSASGGRNAAADLFPRLSADPGAGMTSVRTAASLRARPADTGDGGSLAHRVPNARKMEWNPSLLNLHVRVAVQVDRREGDRDGEARSDLADNLRAADHRRA